jgi:hypothetical protein
MKTAKKSEKLKKCRVFFGAGFAEEDGNRL